MDDAEVSGQKHPNEEERQMRYCLPASKIAFAKTHKTGSTTVQNVLFRHAHAHNLNLALPADGWEFYAGSKTFQAGMIEEQVLGTKKLNYIAQFINFFSLSFQGMWKGLELDVFAFHSVWNFPEVKKVLSGDEGLPPIVFTILRDPVASFESMFVYMELRRTFGFDWDIFIFSNFLLQ